MRGISRGGAQAGRVLRPLLRMLGVVPLPEVVVARPERATGVPGVGLAMALPEADFEILATISKNCEA